MKRKSTKFALALCATGILGMGATQAAVMSYTGTFSGSDDSWNDAARWDSGIPSGVDSAVILANQTVNANNNATPTYSGGLTLSSSSRLTIHDDDDLGALGTTTVALNFGSTLTFRGLTSQTFNQTFSLLDAGATIEVGESTQTSGTAVFANGITGAFAFNITGSKNSRASLSAANSFTSLTTLGNTGFGEDAFVLQALASGSLGTGDVTINDTDSLLIAPDRCDQCLQLLRDPDPHRCQI
jgi:hypothetical protein